MKNKTKTANVQEEQLAKIVDIKTKLGNPKLPAGVRNFLTLALVVVVAAFTKSCNGDPQPKLLDGTVNISGKMGVDDQLTANITGSTAAAGKFTYQWVRQPDGSSVLDIIDGATGKHYTITPADVGHRLGAVVGTTDKDFVGTRSGISTDKAFLRTFDLTLGGKAVVLRDATGGATELPAATRTKIQTGLNGLSFGGSLAAKFNAIHATGNFEIVIEGGDFYQYGKFNGYQILFHKDWVSNVATTTNAISGEVFDIIELNMPCAPNCQCPESHAMAPSQSNVRMAKAVPQYNRAMQLRDNRIASRQVRQRLG